MQCWKELQYRLKSYSIVSSYLKAQVENFQSLQQLSAPLSADNTNVSSQSSCAAREHTCLRSLCSKYKKLYRRN